MSDKEDVTVFSRDDIDQLIKNIDSQKKYIMPVCAWCNIETMVREVGPNLICQECEIKERKAKRPLIFTSPVSDAYWKISNE